MLSIIYDWSLWGNFSFLENQTLKLFNLNFIFIMYIELLIQNLNLCLIAV